MIVQDSTFGTRETMQLTTTIPIVMALVVDPVGQAWSRACRVPAETLQGSR